MKNRITVTQLLEKVKELHPFLSFRIESRKIIGSHRAKINENFQLDVETLKFDFDTTKNTVATFTFQNAFAELQAPMVNTISFVPAIYTVSFTDVTGNKRSFDLLTVDGSTPNETVYFMRNADAPSQNDSDKINELIDAQDWTVSAADNIFDFAIDVSIFATSGEAYSAIADTIRGAQHFLEVHKEEIAAGKSITENVIHEWVGQTADQYPIADYKTVESIILSAI